MTPVELVEEGVAEPPPGAIHRHYPEPDIPEARDSDISSAPSGDWATDDVAPASPHSPHLVSVSQIHRRTFHRWRPTVGPSPTQDVPIPDDPVAARELLTALASLPSGMVREITRAVEEVAATLRDGFEHLDPSIWGEAGPEDEYEYATTAILAAVEARRGRERLVERSYSLEEGAGLLNIDPTEVERLLEERRLVGVVEDGHWRLPDWQFSGDHVIDGVAEAAQAFPGGVEWLTAWMTTPHPELDDETPRDQLLDGELDTVLALVRSMHG